VMHASELRACRVAAAGKGPHRALAGCLRDEPAPCVLTLPAIVSSGQLDGEMQVHFLLPYRAWRGLPGNG
jgi:hypothetical protein